jgi:hypothetical protein
VKKLLLTLVFVVLAGCGGSDDPTGLAARTGVYALSSINGQTLPLTVEDRPGFSRTVTSGRLELDNDATFVDRITYRVDDNGTITTPTDASEGTFTVSGRRLELTYNGTGSVLVGAFSGSTLTVTAGAATFTFVRQ